MQLRVQERPCSCEKHKSLHIRSRVCNHVAGDDGSDWPIAAKSGLCRREDCSHPGNFQASIAERRLLATLQESFSTDIVPLTGVTLANVRRFILELCEAALRGALPPGGVVAGVAALSPDVGQHSSIPAVVADVLWCVFVRGALSSVRCGIGGAFGDGTDRGTEERYTLLDGGHVRPRATCQAGHTLRGPL